MPCRQVRISAERLSAMARKKRAEVTAILATEEPWGKTPFCRKRRIWREEREEAGAILHQLNRGWWRPAPPLGVEYVFEQDEEDRQTR